MNNVNIPIPPADLNRDAEIYRRDPSWIHLNGFNVVLKRIIDVKKLIHEEEVHYVELAVKRIEADKMIYDLDWKDLSYHFISRMKELDNSCAPYVKELASLYIRQGELVEVLNKKAQIITQLPHVVVVDEKDVLSIEVLRENYGFSKDIHVAPTLNATEVTAALSRNGILYSYAP